MAQGERVISRTVELLAWRFNGESKAEMPDWVRGHVLHSSSVGMTILLPTGEWQLKPGGWITMEVGGSLALCSAEEFAKRYRTLSDDIGAVQLTNMAATFMPDAWNRSIVERAAVAFHESMCQEPWADVPEAERAATRLAMRKALTAAISIGPKSN